MVILVNKKMIIFKVLNTHFYFKVEYLSAEFLYKIIRNKPAHIMLAYLQHYGKIITV